ncbi:MAG: response regulator [Candidatus Glassbacteria bacterium]|nr:response regulator [Candidatus Glassbacteria bacterium]
MSVKKRAADSADLSSLREKCDDLRSLLRESLDATIRLSRNNHAILALTGMPILYLDSDLRINAYTSNFLHLTTRVAEFSQGKKHLSEFLTPDGFEEVQAYLARHRALETLDYDRGGKWRMVYSGFDTADEIGSFWQVGGKCSGQYWTSGERDGKRIIVHTPHPEDNNDCYLMSREEYGGAREDIRVRYRFRTPDDAAMIRDLSLVINGTAVDEHFLCDTVGYTVLSGSVENTIGGIQSRAAYMTTVRESLDPATDYEVDMERIGGRLVRRLRNLSTGKKADDLVAIDPRAVFDGPGHVGFTTFSGAMEIHGIEIFTRPSRFSIDQFRLQFDTEVQIAIPELKERLFNLKLEQRVIIIDQMMYMLMFEDVTERKRAESALLQSESRYRTLFDTLSQGIISFGPDGRITSFNPAALEILGLDSDQMEQVDNSDEGWNTIRESGKRFPADQFPVAVALRTGKPVYATVMGVFNPRQQKFRWIKVDAVPQYGADGEVAEVFCGFNDLTAQKEAEENRRKLTEQLHQSQKMELVGRLAGGVAHDFNNLLTAIIGNADLALTTIDPEASVYEDLTEIKATADRAAELTRQLLAFSSRQIVKLKIVNINDVLEDIDKLMRRLIGEHIELTTLPQDGLWPVKIDPGQLEQVLTNLVVNAQDAMPDGGKLTLETANVTLDREYTANHAGTKPGDYVVLAVSDTGTGMDESTLKHIFEPFFTTKEHGKGTGLGLSTSYGMVKQNRGNIWAYSEKGVGTTIKVYLPRSMGKSAGREAEGGRGKSPRGTETILVAEDEPSVRQVVARSLRNTGYHVLEAEDGVDALGVVKAYRGEIHLLVTDVVMPRMGGHDLSRKLEEQYPGLKVLYISGYSDNSIVHHGILDQGIEFIQKPFQPSQLITKIRELLDADNQ